MCQSKQNYSFSFKNFYHESATGYVVIIKSLIVYTYLLYYGNHGLVQKGLYLNYIFLYQKKYTS